MKKEQFLDALAGELGRLGADEATRAAQKAKMDAYLRSKNIEEVDIDPHRMAEGIMQKLSEDRKPAESRKPAEGTGVPSEKPVAGKPSAGAEDPLSALPEKQQRAVHNNGGSGAGKPAPTKDRTDKTVARQPEKKPQKSNAVTDPVTDPEYYSKAPAAKKPADTENKTLFWVLFCAAVPLGAILCAAAVALFAGLILLLAAAAIGFVAALIAIVGAGCSIALIGIIYGAYKIVTGVVPIGLYEIGLGITVGSVASLIGILMYNIAIRLVPFLMKKLTELVGFGLRKARDGFTALKGALENK